MKACEKEKNKRPDAPELGHSGSEPINQKALTFGTKGVPAKCDHQYHSLSP